MTTDDRKDRNAVIQMKQRDKLHSMSDHKSAQMYTNKCMSMSTFLFTQLKNCKKIVQLIHIKRNRR